MQTSIASSSFLSFTIFSPVT